MTDVREDILARLFEVVATVPNLRSVYRNNEDINETDLPAGIVLDGDEETDGAGDVSMKQPHRPYNVQMMPNILILHNDPSTTEFGTLRRELIKRVLFDAVLAEQIVKTGRFGNGAIRYLGCQVGHAWLRNLHGALKAQFLFKYTLRPEEL